MARSYPLVIRQGETLTKPFRRRYKGGPHAGQVIEYLDHDITVARLQVRDKHASAGGVVLLDLSTENGGITLGKYDDGTGKEWSGYLYASPQATRTLVPFGDAVWALVMSTEDRSWVKALFAGPAILLPATTVMED